MTIEDTTGWFIRSARSIGISAGGGVVAHEHRRVGATREKCGSGRTDVPMSRKRSRDVREGGREASRAGGLESSQARCGKR